MSTFRYHLDTRDGTVYPCVLMPDGKWWSAVNLNWSGAGVCYNNDPANGAIYGRLYTFVEANSSCPSGTHLPTDAEWTALENAVPDPDGTRLKANSALWITNTGTDDYGFSALPGGWYDYTGVFKRIREEACLWTSTATGSGISYNRKIRYLYRNNSEVSSSIVSGSSSDAMNFKCSIRFIVDTFVDPLPPTATVSYAGGHGFVTLTAPSATSIRYSLDGSAPTLPYSGPVLADAVVRAVAVYGTTPSTEAVVDARPLVAEPFLPIADVHALTRQFMLEQYK